MKRIALCALFSTLVMSSCQDKAAKNANDSSKSSQKITIDGSSTVFPISEAVAEEFQKANKGERVTIGVSGTGGGFKKFCRNEVLLTGASRPVKKSERDLCQKAGINFVELPVAYDGIAIVVNKENTWAKDLTVAELKKMWEPGAQKKITNWNQIRESFPDAPLRLFGPGVDSGTYDYFTKAIVGKEHASRGDFTSSEDDNVLVHGIKGDKNALGFFGYAYYKENKDVLSLVAVDDQNDDNGKGPIAASPKSVADGTYQPLSRPVFVYVNDKAAAQPSVQKYVSFMLKEARPLVEETGYIRLSDAAYAAVQKRFDAKTQGSLFEGGSKVGATVESLLGLTK